MNTNNNKLFILIYRSHKEQMFKLRKLLSESSKSRRRRRNLINIHITILNWMTEFLGFFFVILGSFILGHDNHVVTFFLQILTIVFYFNILPCTFLINDSELKGIIADNKLYILFLSLFTCHANNEHEVDDGEVPNKDNNIAQVQMNEDDIFKVFPEFDIFT